MAGTLTGKQLRERVGRNLGEGAGDARLVEINENIRFAIEWAANLHEWKDLDVIWTFNTVASTETTTLAAIATANSSTGSIANILHAVVEDGTNSHSLPVRAWTDMRDAYPKPDELPEAKPQALYRNKDTLYIYPVPDAIYTIRLWAKLDPTVITDSTTCLIGGIDAAIAEYATALSTLAEEDGELFGTRMGAAERIISAVMSKDNRDNMQTQTLQGYQPRAHARQRGPFPNGLHVTDDT